MFQLQLKFWFQFHKLYLCTSHVRISFLSAVTFAVAVSLSGSISMSVSMQIRLQYRGLLVDYASS